eukprot:366073-Chlamydomonas_euryale.AAC.9
MAASAVGRDNDRGAPGCRVSSNGSASDRGDGVRDPRGERRVARNATLLRGRAESTYLGQRACRPARACPTATTAPTSRRLNTAHGRAVGKLFGGRARQREKGGSVAAARARRRGRRQQSIGVRVDRGFITGAQRHTTPAHTRSQGDPEGIRA